MQLRFPAGSITISQNGPSSAFAEVRLDTWNHWLSIAREMTQRAEAAHEALLAARAAEGGIPEMEEEFRSAMLSIAAQAFAIDALYAIVQERLCRRPTRGARRTARYKLITETLRQGFRVGSQSTKTMRAYFRQLFQFRDWAVHPPNDFRQPIYHDVLDADVEWRFVVFSAANARNSLDKTVGIFDQLLSLTKDTEKEVRDWASSARVLLDSIVGPVPPDQVSP